MNLGKAHVRAGGTVEQACSIRPVILLAQLACDRPLHAELSDRDGPATLSYAIICREVSGCL